MPIAVSDELPPEAKMRDVVSQALEYKRALGECSARIDVLRDIREEK